MTVRRCDSSAYTLASNLSATGAAVAIPGGEYTFTAEGAPAGATVGLQMQTSNGSWVTVQVFTGSQVQSATLPFSQTGIDLPACNVRMVATGGAPSGLYASLVGLG